MTMLYVRTFSGIYIRLSTRGHFGDEYGCTRRPSRRNSPPFRSLHKHHRQRLLAQVHHSQTGRAETEREACAPPRLLFQRCVRSTLNAVGLPRCMLLVLVSTFVCTNIGALHTCRRPARPAHEALGRVQCFPKVSPPQLANCYSSASTEHTHVQHADGFKLVHLKFGD